MTFTLNVQLDKAIVDVGRAVSIIIRKITFDIHGAILDQIRKGPKTGRLYRRGKKTHRASAPGETPASDTGFLINSVQVRPASSSNPFIGEVFVAAEYAAYLEYGAPRANLKARPYVIPAIQGVISKLQSSRVIQ